jgi:Tetratricopeptide repeat
VSAWFEHFARARAAIDLKRWDVAHEEILHALLDSPDHPLLHATRAEIRYRLGDLAEAREAAREAIARDPNWYAGYYWLAWSIMSDFLFGPNRAEESLRISDQALKCSPNEPDCHYLRAMAARFAGNHQEAVTYGESGLTIDPEHVGCLEALARSQAELGDQNAESTWRRLLQIRPESVAAHEELARITLHAEHFAEAYEHVSAAIRQEPNSSALRDLYGEVVRHQHPLARFFLWTSKPWQGHPALIYIIVAIGLAPLLSLKLLPKGTDKRIEAVLAALAFFFCLGFAFYGAWAIVAAETIIAHSAQFSRLVPETRALRPAYAFAWIAAVVIILAVLTSAALMTAQPILLAGNTVVAGIVELIARRSPDGRRRHAARLAMGIPLAVEVIALFGSFPESIRGAAPGLILGAWCITVAAPLIITDRRV